MVTDKWSLINQISCNDMIGYDSKTIKLIPYNPPVPPRSTAQGAQGPLIARLHSSARTMFGPPGILK